MEMAPVPMVADTQILDQRCLTPDNRDCQCLNTLCCRYKTAVAIGLFLETLPSFYLYIFSPMQFLIPLHRAEIGCTEQNVHL